MIAPCQRRGIRQAATLLVATLVPATVGGAPAPGPQELVPAGRAGAPPPPELIELPSGARWIGLESAELERMGLVEGLLLFAVGSVHDPEGRSGLVAVLADALRAGGSVLHNGTELSAWLERNGAWLEVSAGVDTLELAFSCPYERLEGMLERTIGLLVTPAYPEEALDAARQRVADRTVLGTDSPLSTADDTLREIALGSRSPWVRAPRPSELAAVERGEVLAFHRAHLGQSTLWIGTACGPAAAAHVRAQVERAVAGLQRASEPLTPREPRFSQEASGPIWLVDRPGLRMVELRVAVRAPPGEDDARALALWISSLGHRGGGDPALRAARRRVEGLRFEPLEGRRAVLPLAWVAAGSAPVDETAPALETLMATLSSKPRRAEGSEALERARGELQPELAPREQLRELVRDAAAGIAPGVRAAELELVAAVGADEVAEVVSKRLPLRPPLIVAVGPSALVLEALRELGPVTLFGGQAQPRGTAEGLALRARLLDAVGGAVAWARLAGVQLRGEVRQEGSERPVSVRLWRDLLGRRLRLEHEQVGVPTTVVVTPRDGWSFAIQSVFELPADQHARVLARERRQLAQVLHELAVDPRLESRGGAGGRLELYERGEPLCWIELDEAGRPARLGYGEDGNDPGLYVYDDWRETEDLLWPALVTQPGNDTISRWAKLTPLRTIDAALFERPGR